MILNHDQTIQLARMLGMRWAQTVVLSECKHCRQLPEVALGILLQSDGRPQVRAYCPTCYEQKGRTHWRTSSLPNPGGLIETFDLPVVATNLDPNHLCERCGDGSRGVQLHHWAPQSIFKDDAWRWPMAYLCVACHKEWHIRTGIADTWYRKDAA